jgi:2-polyprenyl-6-methoxyphenol hydroxylase-like FAD-dependent oxidoreductase
LRVLIAGGGIAGLTLAALLRQRGIAPDIVEAAPTHDRQSYVLGLFPLGTRVLHGLGVHRSFTAVSEPANDPNDLRLVARGDLLRLLERAGDNERLRMATCVENISQFGERVRVKTSDGEERDYDLVVGADGADSRARAFVSPKTDSYDTHWACWSWWTPRSHARPAREIRDRAIALGLYATPRQTGVIACAPDRTRGLSRMFARFDDLAGAAISEAPGAAEVFHWRIKDSRARTWRRGRVVLLGDAACAFLPTAGIGASLAMESASVLAEELSRSDAAHVASALAFYEARRRPRLESAQDASRKIAKAIYPRLTLFSRPRRGMHEHARAAQIAKLSAEPI